jgi:hypothetical protein
MIKENRNWRKMNKNLKVEVTAHDGFLIVNAVKPEKDDNFMPAGGSTLGCILKDTSKYLGMSKEAFELLKTIKKSCDDIGDVMAWKKEDTHFFGWLGGIKNLIDIREGETSSSRDGILQDLKFNEIPNNVPVEAFEIITKTRNNSAEENP